MARLKDLLFGVAVASTLTNMAMGEYVIHDDPAYLSEESEEEIADAAPDTCVMTQNGLTPAACAQLITGVALFAVGAYLAVSNER